MKCKNCYFYCVEDEFCSIGTTDVIKCKRFLSLSDGRVRKTLKYVHPYDPRLIE